jgi:hypothetical protein
MAETETSGDVASPSEKPAQTQSKGSVQYERRRSDRMETNIFELSHKARGTS